MRKEFNPSEDTVAGKRWYVIYLLPRSEKVAVRYLERLDYEVFLPTRQETRQWKNRQKQHLEIPLFPNYLFVFCQEYELYLIRSFPRIAGFVSMGGHPAFLSEREISSIRLMLRCGQELKAEPHLFHQDQPVRIRTGLLAGYEGIMVRRRGKTRFGLQLKAINYTVWIDSETSGFEPL